MLSFSPTWIFSNAVFHPYDSIDNNTYTIFMCCKTFNIFFLVFGMALNKTIQIRILFFFWVFSCTVRNAYLYCSMVLHLICLILPFINFLIQLLK